MHYQTRNLYNVPKHHIVINHTSYTIHGVCNVVCCVWIIVFVRVKTAWCYYYYYLHMCVSVVFCLMSYVCLWLSLLLRNWHYHQKYVSMVLLLCLTDVVRIMIVESITTIIVMSGLRIFNH